MAGQLCEGRQTPRTAGLQVGGHGLADDWKDGQTGGEDSEGGEGAQARIGIEEDRGVEKLEGGPHREARVMIGGGPVAVTGAREGREVVDGRGTGRGVAAGAAWEAGEG